MTACAAPPNPTASPIAWAADEVYPSAGGSGALSANQSTHGSTTGPHMMPSAPHMNSRATRPQYAQMSLPMCEFGLRLSSYSARVVPEI